MYWDLYQKNSINNNIKFNKTDSYNEDGFYEKEDVN